MIRWFIYYWLLCIATTVLSTKASSEIQGSSQVARATISLFATLGIISALTEFIISFWHMKWWMPITSFISAMVSAKILVQTIGGLMRAKDMDGGIGIAVLFSIAGVAVFGVLSFIDLLTL